MKRLVPLLAMVTGLCACLRPGQERAERDLGVGRAEDARIEVRVEDGLAAVRELSEARIALWASAPGLTVQLRSRLDAAQTVSLALDNAMPEAALTVMTGEAAIEEQPAAHVTERRFAVTLDGRAEVSLRFQVRDADRVAPFTFAVLSDVQNAIDRVQDVFQHINRTHAERPIAFLLGAGDLTERGRRSQLVRFQEELDTLEVPYYTTLGNHELGEEPTYWHELYGRASFSFDYRGVRFSLLDSASASIDPMVYEALAPWLEGARDRMHIVATHIPPVDPVGVRNGSFASRNEAAKLLGMLAQAQVDLTLYGHIHSYYGFVNAGIAAHISGGGGAIPERFDGLGRHYLVVQVDPAAQTAAVQVVPVDN